MTRPVLEHVSQPIWHCSPYGQLYVHCSGDTRCEATGSSSSPVPAGATARRALAARTGASATQGQAVRAPTQDHRSGHAHTVDENATRLDDRATRNDTILDHTAAYDAVVLDTAAAHQNSTANYPGVRAYVHGFVNLRDPGY
jgi:hypothetical protein